MDGLKADTKSKITRVYRQYYQVPNWSSGSKSKDRVGNPQLCKRQSQRREGSSFRKLNIPSQFMSYTYVHVLVYMHVCMHVDAYIFCVWCAYAYACLHV